MSKQYAVWDDANNAEAKKHLQRGIVLSVEAWIAASAALLASSV